MQDCHSPDLSEFLEAQLPWLQGVALRMLEDYHDAEELVQDACLRFIDNPPPVWDLPRAWLARIVWNLASERRRSRKRHRKREFDLAWARRNDGFLRFSPIRVLCQNENVIYLRRAMDQLPFDQRKVVFLYSTGKRDYEIGEELNLTVGAVRARLRKGRERIRVYMDAKGLDLREVCAHVLLLPPSHFLFMSPLDLGETPATAKEPLSRFCTWLQACTPSLSLIGLMLAILCTTILGFLPGTDDELANKKSDLSARMISIDADRSVPPIDEDPPASNEGLPEPEERVGIADPLIPDMDAIAEFGKGDTRSLVPCPKGMELLTGSSAGKTERPPVPGEVSLGLQDGTSVKLGPNGNWADHWTKHDRSEDLHGKDGYLIITDDKGQSLWMRIRNLQGAGHLLGMDHLLRAAWPTDVVPKVKVTQVSDRKRPDSTTHRKIGEPTPDVGWLRIKIQNEQRYMNGISSLADMRVRAFLFRIRPSFDPIKWSLPIVRIGRTNDLGEMLVGALKPGHYWLFLTFDGKLANKEFRIRVRPQEETPLLIRKSSAVAVELLPHWAEDEGMRVELWKLGNANEGAVQEILERDGWARDPMLYFPGDPTRPHLVSELVMHPRRGPEWRELLEGRYLAVVRNYGYALFDAKGSFMQVDLSEAKRNPKRPGGKHFLEATRGALHAAGSTPGDRETSSRPGIFSGDEASERPPDSERN